MFNLTINNYRSFLNQEFKFSKYNILIGENSSGKSSLLKFFLMLKQTLDYKTENLLLHRPYVDLGNYQDVIYYNNENLNISFSFEFDDKYNDYYYNYFAGEELNPEEQRKYINNLKTKINLSKKSNKISFEINRNLNSSSDLKITISNEELGDLIIRPTKRERDDSPLMDQIDECFLTYKKNDQIIIDNVIVGYSKEGFLALIYSQDLFKQCELVHPNSSLFYEIAWLLLSQNYLSNEILNIAYVNPMDSHPKRFYYEREPQTPNVIFTLDDIIHLLSSSKISKALREKFENRFNDVIKEYGIADGFKIIKEEKLRISEIKIQVKDLQSNITEVGYGVSLQLPILFKALLSQNQSMLIEQPEVHLHPKLQAELIQILVKYGNAKSYFIETHSEYIVRKFQVLIKEKFMGLSSDDITIHYFIRENEKSVITSHKIDEDGRLSPLFPSGFFDNSYKITSGLFK